MGGNLATDRTIWMPTAGTILIDTNFQGSADYEILSGELGMRTEDHGATFAASTDLGSLGSGGMLTDTGLIRSMSDQDTFKFQVTNNGTYDIWLSVADVGPNLDSKVWLKDSIGSILATADPSDDLNALIHRNLSPGTYYVTVGSHAEYTGDVGHYTVRVQDVSLTVEFTKFAYSVSDHLWKTRYARSGGDAPASLIPQEAHVPMSTKHAPAMHAVARSHPTPESHLPAHDAAMAEWTDADLLAGLFAAGPKG
jgi:hypothetical protein